MVTVRLGEIIDENPFFYIYRNRSSSLVTTNIKTIVEDLNKRQPLGGICPRQQPILSNDQIAYRIEEAVLVRAGKNRTEIVARIKPEGPQANQLMEFIERGCTLSFTPYSLTMPLYRSRKQKLLSLLSFDLNLDL